MQTKEKVLQQIEQLGQISTFGTKKEINYLPEILRADEKIHAITSGFYNGNTWLITCTDTRIIFLDKGMIYGLQQIEIPLDKVNSIQVETGLIFADIVIWDGASKVKIENISKDYARKFVDLVNNAIHLYKNKSFQPQIITNTEDTVTKLEKLASLKEKGVLTEDEFQSEKKKILAA